MCCFIKYPNQQQISAHPTKSDFWHEFKLSSWIFRYQSARTHPHVHKTHTHITWLWHLRCCVTVWTCHDLVQSVASCVRMDGTVSTHCVSRVPTKCLICVEFNFTVPNDHAQQCLLNDEMWSCHRGTSHRTLGPPSKNVYITLFSGEVRSACSKILWKYWPAQIIRYQLYY